jgi:hypothetical protein
MPQAIILHSFMGQKRVHCLLVSLLSSGMPMNLEVSSCWLHQLSTGTQHASLLLMHWVIYGFHRKEGDQSFASGVKPPTFACLVLWLIYSP